MQYTNRQMEQMLKQLNAVGDAKGILAYAVARNRRFLTDETKEYFDARNKLIYELGEPMKDADGKETGEIGIKADSPNFQEFVKEMDGYLDIFHEPRIFRVAASRVIDQMTADQMNDLEWMIDFDMDKLFDERTPLSKSNG